MARKQVAAGSKQYTSAGVPRALDMPFGESIWERIPNESVIDRWEHHIRHSGRLAKRTVDRYVVTVVELEWWLTKYPGVAAKDLKLVDIRRSDVVNFMAYLEHDRHVLDKRDGCTYHSPLSPSSRKNALAAIRSFYRWLMYIDDSREVDPTMAVDRPKVVTVKGDVLTREELGRLLYHRDGKPRERIQTWLLAHTGCRVEEIANLRWHDVDLVQKVIHVIGKGQKHRVVDITDDLLPELLKWERLQRREAWANPAIAEALKRRDTAYVLLTKNGKQVATTTLWRSVKRRAYRAGVRPLEVDANKHGRRKDMQSEITCHMLRRTLATILLEEGVHMDTVSDILGHEDTSTTRRFYTNPRDDRRTAAMQHFRVA